MAFVLVVRMRVAEGNEERAAEVIPELVGELFGLLESRERAFYETVVD